MLISLFRITTLVVSFVTIAFLTSCTASKATGTQFYILNSLGIDSALVENQDGKPLSIEVASLRLPQYLERPQIVTRSGNNKLKVAEFHQWGGNLRKNMMRVLATNLSQLLVTPNITISSYLAPEPPDFRVELEVLQFEQDFQGRVSLSVQWRLSEGKKRSPIESQITNLSSPVVSDTKNYEDTVSAMSSLYGELSRVIAKVILKHNSEASK